MRLLLRLSGLIRAARGTRSTPTSGLLQEARRRGVFGGRQRLRLAGFANFQCERLEDYIQL